MEKINYSKHFTLTIDNATNIATICFNKDLAINLTVAKQIREDRLKILGNTDSLIIINAVGMASIEDDARAYWATKEAFEGVKAVAVITTKKWQAMIVNFFITFNKPPAPTKLFTDTNSAVNWINKFTTSLVS